MGLAFKSDLAWDLMKPGTHNIGETGFSLSSQVVCAKHGCIRYSCKLVNTVLSAKMIVAK